MPDTKPAAHEDARKLAEKVLLECANASIRGLAHPYAALYDGAAYTLARGLTAALAAKEAAERERDQWMAQAERFGETMRGLGNAVGVPAHESAQVMGDAVLQALWRVIPAEALADAVASLVVRKVIDERSVAADALLDYRNPPRTERSDALAAAERELAALRADAERYRWLRNCDGRLMVGDPTQTMTRWYLGAEADAIIDALRAEPGAQG